MFTQLSKNLVLSLLLIALLVSGCSAGASNSANPITENPSQSASNSSTKLTLAGYSTPAEAYGKIIPLFTVQWKQQNNQDVTFDQSYAGSGAQSRAVIGGLEADVVALSLEGDVTNIVKAGLITRDWQAGAPNKGIVTTSLVAFAVR